MKRQELLGKEDGLVHGAVDNAALAAQQIRCQRVARIAIASQMDGDRQNSKVLLVCLQI